MRDADIGHSMSDILYSIFDVRLLREEIERI